MGKPIHIRLVELEARMSQLESSLKSAQPALSAARMFVPIGGTSCNPTYGPRADGKGTLLNDHTLERHTDAADKENRK